MPDTQERTTASEQADARAALDQVTGLLGGWWKYVVTDVTEAASGNGERMAFVYDRRRVAFGGLAGEIVLPPEKVKTEVLQFARTPFVCGFRPAGRRSTSARSTSTTARVSCSIAAGWRRSVSRPSSWPSAPKTGAPDNLILLGDFNFFTAGDATLKAITDQAFRSPRC